VRAQPPAAGERVAIKKITDVFMHVSVRRARRSVGGAARGPAPAAP